MLRFQKVKYTDHFAKRKISIQKIKITGLKGNEKKKKRLSNNYSGTYRARMTLACRDKLTGAILA